MWWVIVLYFMGSMMICFFAVFFFCKIYRSVKGVLFPTSQLPSHFKEVCSGVLVALVPPGQLTGWGRWC